MLHFFEKNDNHLKIPIAVVLNAIVKYETA